MLNGVMRVCPFSLTSQHPRKSYALSPMQMKRIRSHFAMGSEQLLDSSNEKYGTASLSQCLPPVCKHILFLEDSTSDMTRIALLKTLGTLISMYNGIHQEAMPLVPALPSCQLRSFSFDADGKQQSSGASENYRRLGPTVAVSVLRFCC